MGQVLRDFHLPGRSAVFASNGLCATSHPLAAATAIDILKAGGNAMDAAIGGAVLLGLCEPQMTGLGGDCFVLFNPPSSDDVKAMNGSGRAPAALDPDAIRALGHTVMPEGGALPVTIPGAVDAFCRLSEDWGKLGLDRILAPAIEYFEAGIPVAPRTAIDWQFTQQYLEGRARDFYLINGAAPKVGQIYRNPAQAALLRLIARDGRKGFYEGPAAEDMLTALSEAGGTHTVDDFANFACDYTDPVSGDYGSFEIVEHPPNGQGAAALLLMNILKRFDLAAMEPFGSQRAHIEAEATKLAYDARNRFIADSDHTTRLNHLLSETTADGLASLIDPNRAMKSATALSEQVHKDTIYITVVDRDRMAVSLIYSIFRSFGSGLASDKFGILFQNRGSGFNLIPGHPNEAGGSKRPMHTIIPGMLKTSGRVVQPFGVMGGAYQANGHARFVSNLSDFGLDPQATIDAPRTFPWDGKLRIERGYDANVLQELADKGHDVVIPDKPIGGAQTILIDHANGTLQGASDPRKDGCAIGY